MPPAKKYLTQAEFARRMGVSKTAISKAIKNGRISFCDKKKNGHFLINWDEESVNFLESKTSSTSWGNSKKAKSADLKVPEKVSDKAIAKAIKTTSSVEEERETIKKVRALTMKAGKMEEYIPDIPDMQEAKLKDGLPKDVRSRISKEMEGKPKIGTVAYNSNRKLAADADRSELKFAQELKQVIPTEVAILLAGSIMTSIKEALLALPSRTVGLIEAEIKTKVDKWKEGESELVYNSVLNILDSSVKEILDSASKGVENLPNDVEAYFEKK